MGDIQLCKEGGERKGTEEVVEDGAEGGGDIIRAGVDVHLWMLIVVIVRKAGGWLFGLRTKRYASSCLP